MLNKMNQWIVLSTIAMATTALIGCNKGGGGGGGPTVDCRQVQNFSNATCLNASRGNINNPYGGRRVVGAGGYRSGLPPDGIVPLSNPNLVFMSSLCSSSNNTSSRTRRAGSNVRRQNTGWGGSDDGDAYYQDAAYMNDVCLNLGTVVLSFSTDQVSEGTRRYWIGWKLYFVPIGIPVPPGTPIEQIRAWSRDTSTGQFDDSNIRLGPTGFGARSPEGMGLDFVKNGDSLNVTVTGRRGPIGSATMGFQGF
jgi:hypothetical protein